MAGSNLGTLLLNIVTRSDTSGLNKTDSALRKTQNSVKNVAKDVGFLSKLGKAAMGYFAWGKIQNALGSYLQLEKDIGAMKSRFFAVTGDEKQAAEEFEWIRKVATDTANDIKSTADSYSIFYSAVRKNMGEEATKEVFEDWTRVGRVLHLSEYQMERVTYALREMASKGAIYSQDLRMQIGTHVPNAMGLAQKAAEEMGIKGTDWFEQLQKKAKGSTQVTAEFVRRFSQQAKQMYGSETAFKKAMQQPDALANEIRNIGTNFMLDFSKAGGSYMTVKILQGIANVLLKIDYNALANLLGGIAHGVGDIASFITKHIGIMTGLLRTVVILLTAIALEKGLSTLGNFLKGFKGLGSGKLKIFDRILWGLISSGKTGTKIADTLLNFTSFFKSVTVGILGRIAGVVGILLIIKDVVNWLRGKYIDRKTKEMFESGQFLNTGFTNKEVSALLSNASKAGITSQSQLTRYVQQRGYGSIAQYFAYHDNGKMTVYVYQDEFDPEMFAENLSKQKSQMFNTSTAPYFKNPTLIDRIFNPDKVGKQDLWTPLNSR